MLHPHKLVEHGFIGSKLTWMNRDQIPNRPFLILKKFFEGRAKYARYDWPRSIMLAAKTFQVFRA